MAGLKAGFVGVGKMGAPMAARLLKAGYDVTVYDPAAASVAALVALGAKAASSPRAVGDAAEIMLASLPSPQILEAATLGPDGIAEGKSARVLVDLSTTGARAAAAIAARLKERDIAMIDAPVSGGLKGAREGTLAVMASGP